MPWQARHGSLHSSMHKRAISPAHSPDNVLNSLQNLGSHILAKRQGDYASSTYGSDSGDTSSNGSGADGAKADGGPDTTSIAIACGVIIPLAAALVLFIFLHRRNVRRMQIEDATDKHGSLDFGMGEVRPKHPDKHKTKGLGKKKQEMSEVDTQTHMMLRGGKGMSYDMGSPYVLSGDPVSRTSFNSMSRSLTDGDDPYRPVHLIKEGSNSPTYPHSPQYPPSRLDSPSLFTVSSKSPLVHNGRDPATDTGPSHLDMPLPPPPPISRKPVGATPGAELEGDSARSELDSTPMPASAEEHRAPSPAPQLAANTFESSFNLPDDVASHIGPYGDSHGTAAAAEPAQRERASLGKDLPEIHEPNEQHHSDALDDYTTYADVLGIAQGPRAEGLPTIMEPGSDGLGLQALSVEDANRYSAHIRPLPPTDPNDTAEQRANRIRSFYREYFDESNDNNGNGDAGDYYYEDYGQEYLNDAAIYDPATGQFIMPGAPYGEPIGRRAMTPPPRGPPRFRGGPGFGTRSSGGTYSGGRRQRAYSSASGRAPVGHPRGRPKKKLPPPTPLVTLPTPHNLKEDTGIFNALDFAPPTTFRDRQLGRPESPSGNVARPFSPSVRAFSPLVSSHDDLAVMPSPHMLRKSATFTGLDFAPPPRMRDPAGGGGSDNGSIRSGRSGRSGHVTPLGMHSIRKGVYRVSRLPPEMVGTRDDLAASLRPKMSLVSSA